MLDEEKELRQYFRDWMADNYTDEQKYYRKDVARLITALIRAVREDAAKVAEAVPSCDCNMKTFMPNAHLVGCEQITANVIAEAIRAKK